MISNRKNQIQESRSDLAEIARLQKQTIESHTKEIENRRQILKNFFKERSNQHTVFSVYQKMQGIHPEIEALNFDSGKEGIGEDTSNSQRRKFISMKSISGMMVEKPL